MKYGLITKRNDLPTLQKQRDALSMCDRIMQEPTPEMLSAIRAGNQLTVYSLKCFAFERSEGYQPRKAAIRNLGLIEKDGVTVNVINSGQSYHMMADSGRLSRDVLDALAGVRAVKQGRGRPKHPAPAEGDVSNALLIWRDTVSYSTDDQARNAIKAKCVYKWSNARIREHLGKSGRKPGRK